MMISIVFKKQASIVLFCLYFIAYTISPLTFTVSDAQAQERQHSTGAAAFKAKSGPVFLWNFVTEEAFAHYAYLQNHVNTSVLIKKKRALASEITSEKLLPFEKTVILKSYDDSLLPAIGRLNVTRSTTRRIHKGFYSICAGHSPPFTS